jgi:hypothetical protein
MKLIVHGDTPTKKDVPIATMGTIPTLPKLPGHTYTFVIYERIDFDSKNDGSVEVFGN